MTGYSYRNNITSQIISIIIITIIIFLLLFPKKTTNDDYCIDDDDDVYVEDFEIVVLQSTYGRRRLLFCAKRKGCGKQTKKYKTQKTSLYYLPQ